MRSALPRAARACSGLRSRLVGSVPASARRAAQEQDIILDTHIFLVTRPRKGPKMCISPSHVWISRGPMPEQVPVPCKHCWRCRQNRVNDYVARCLAEASTSAHSCVITLTYAPRDDLSDKVLQPRHFQLFMKLLRRAGHKVRYFVAGEYGDENGRAHFHAALFFTEVAKAEFEYQDTMPVLRIPDYNTNHVADPASSARFCREIPHKRMVHIREWPHGHVTVDWSASEKSMRYVAKYLLKEDKNNAWFSLSKKPALGAAWFALKAARNRELGVMPRGFDYLPPGGNRDKSYMMTGASRRDYLLASIPDELRDGLRYWSRDISRARLSEWVQKSFDKADKHDRLKIGRQDPEFLQRSIDTLVNDIERQLPHAAASAAAAERLHNDMHMSENEIDRHLLRDDITLRMQLAGFDDEKAFEEYEVERWAEHFRREREAGRPINLHGCRRSTPSPERDAALEGEQYRARAGIT